MFKFFEIKAPIKAPSTPEIAIILELFIFIVFLFKLINILTSAAMEKNIKFVD